MEANNLPVFDHDLRITEGLEELVSNKFLQPTPVQLPSLPTNANPIKNLEQVLISIFDENQEETKVNKARKILGDTAKDFTDEKVANLVTDFEFLADSWLNIFEKQLFNGQTLRDALGNPEYDNSK